MLSKFKNIINSFRELSNQVSPAYIYRVAEIVKNEKGQYITIVQVIGKREHFKMKPEEILADDRLTSAFKPIDIRLLTYLGYCGINTPQYKILAKQILTDEKIQFAIYDNKKDDVMILDHSNAQMIDENMIKNLTAADAYDLGFSNGRQSILNEAEALKNIK